MSFAHTILEDLSLLPRSLMAMSLSIANFPKKVEYQKIYTRKKNF